jgi:hypothetical protein
LGFRSQPANNRFMVAFVPKRVPLKCSQPKATSLVCFDLPDSYSDTDGCHVASEEVGTSLDDTQEVQIEWILVLANLC